MPPPELQRVFVVTGCASGIGRRLAERLAERGHRVVATDVAIDALRALAEVRDWDPERVLVLALDVRDADAWERVLDEAVIRFGRLDVLVNLAGHLQSGWVRELEAEQVHLHFDVNTKGVVFGTRAAARRMAVQGGGHIVNVASVSALAPAPGLALFAASKTAVRAFSLAAAEELRPLGVFVTALSPGPVDTPMLARETEREAGARGFAPGPAMSADQVVDLILGEVLQRRPLELARPRGAAWLARLVNVFPTLARSLHARSERLGRRRQLALKDRA